MEVEKTQERKIVKIEKKKKLPTESGEYMIFRAWIEATLKLVADNGGFAVKVDEKTGAATYEYMVEGLKILTTLKVGLDGHFEKFKTQFPPDENGKVFSGVFAASELFTILESCVSMKKVSELIAKSKGLGMPFETKMTMDSSKQEEEKNNKKKTEKEDVKM